MCGRWVLSQLQNHLQRKIETGRLLQNVAGPAEGASATEKALRWTGYSREREQPGEPLTSELKAVLHFGEGNPSTRLT